MSQLQVGRNQFQIERTVELKPGEYESGKLSKKLAGVINTNGADDIIWSTGDRVYLSSGRWTQSETPDLPTGTPVRSNDTLGWVELFAPEDNTEGDVLANIRKKHPNFVPGAKDTKVKAKDAISATAIGAVVGLAARVIAKEQAPAAAETVTRFAGYRAIERVTVTAAPKFAETLAKHPVLTGVAAAAAATAVAFGAFHAGTRHEEHKLQAQLDAEYNQATAKALRPADYDMASLVGTTATP